MIIILICVIAITSIAFIAGYARGVDSMLDQDWEQATKSIATWWTEQGDDNENK